MKAKEQAEALVDKFWNKLFTSDFRELDAKQCALICVDEMLEEVIYEDYTYWEEVKNEIKKL